MKPHLVRYYNDGRKVIIPKTEDEAELFLKRLLFVEYMASSENDHSPKGLRSFAKSIQVKNNILKRWKRTTSFQALVARRAREIMFGGDGIATVYREAHKMISDPNTDDRIKQKLLSDLMRLDLRRVELVLRHSKKKDTEGKVKPVEAIIENIELEEATP